MLRVLIESSDVDPRIVYSREFNFGQAIPGATTLRYVITVDRSTFLALLDPVYAKFREDMIADEKYDPFTDELARLKDAGWPDLEPLMTHHAALAHEVLCVWLNTDALEGLLADHPPGVPPTRYLCNSVDRVRFADSEVVLEGDVYRFDVADAPK
jgi:hypothetical protein